MPNGRARVWLLAAALFAVATVLYAHTWNFELTFLDDNEIILTRAQLLAKSSGFVASFTQRYFLSEVNPYYRPLVNLSFVVNAHLGGSNPWVYHVTNGLLHATACLLLFVLMLRLGIHPACAFVTSLLFAVHPMHVASVAWIPGRNDLLLGCFALGALGLLTLNDEPWGPFGHALCFAGALLCKETAIALPVVFVPYLLSRDGWSKFIRARTTWLAWLLPLAAYYWLRVHCLTVPRGYLLNLFRSALQHPGMLVSDLGKVVFPIHLQVIATARDIDVRLGIAAVLALSFTLMGLRCARTSWSRRVHFCSCRLQWRCCPPIFSRLNRDCTCRSRECAYWRQSAFRRSELLHFAFGTRLWSWQWELQSRSYRWTFATQSNSETAFASRRRRSKRPRVRILPFGSTRNAQFEHPMDRVAQRNPRTLLGPSLHSPHPRWRWPGQARDHAPQCHRVGYRPGNQ